MNWQEIKSSAINSISYEVDSIYVLFNCGDMWQYEAPVSVFKDWLKAESKGRFFNMNIRGKFEAVEV